MIEFLASNLVLLESTRVLGEVRIKWLLSEISRVTPSSPLRTRDIICGVTLRTFSVARKLQFMIELEEYGAQMHVAKSKGMGGVYCVSRDQSRKVQRIGR